MDKEEMRKAFPLLELLSRLCDKDRKIVLSYLNCEACFAIYECIHNGLWNKIIPVKQRKILQKTIGAHKAEFRYLNNKRGCPRLKQKRLVDVAHSTGPILKNLLPLLATHLTHDK
jgi:hypothetical protein